MKALSIAALAIILAVPAAVAASADVQGCDVTLTAPDDTTTFVDISTDGFESFTSWDVVDEVVRVWLPTGDYTARWFDSLPESAEFQWTEFTFSTSCELPVDPTDPPSPEPSPEAPGGLTGEPVDAIVDPIEVIAPRITLPPTDTAP